MTKKEEIESVLEMLLPQFSNLFIAAWDGNIAFKVGIMN